MPDKLVTRWRGILKRRRAKRAELNLSIPKLAATIKRRVAKLNPNKGAKAAAYLLRYVGETESPPASNDAPFLRAWENGLPHDRLDWMIPGQPWCGFACIAAWWFGAEKLLPDGVVYTPNIVNWANSGVHFKSVPAGKARKGDLVVFNFNGGLVDHVGLALGPASNGVIQTVEGNTSPNSAGSQSNGGGVFRRSRPLSQVAVVARPL